MTRSLRARGSMSGWKHAAAESGTPVHLVEYGATIAPLATAATGFVHATKADGQA